MVRVFRIGSVATMHGRSMQPTLNPAEDDPWGYLNADLLFLEKLSLRTYNFSRGDVVVFRCNYFSVLSRTCDLWLKSC